MAYVFSIGLVTLVWVAIIYLNERHGLLSCDRFSSPLLKYLAYAWLGVFLLVMALLVTGAALSPVTSAQLAKTPFYSLFALHLILVVFLLGWWALSGRPGIREFLNIRHERPGEVVAIGIAVGVGGWIFTIIMALLVALLLKSVGVLEEAPQP
ncbi:MAG TPA: hypothetical protein VJZ00_06080, partial [Thermoanaerobaculia bacterium]|nr:hypothetical protein [Thermoanaerobaculia bacterium]